MSSKDAAGVRAAFPEIEQIKDKELAEKIVSIWLDVWRESEWDTFEQIPKNPKKDGDLKLVPHIRAVTAIAVSMVEVLERFHGLKCDMDVVLAGGLLHDVDKLLIYSPSSGDGKTRFSQLLPHATYTGFKMWERGLPVEMVNMVVCHSDNHTKLQPITFEGILVKNADHAESEATRAGRQAAGSVA